MKKIIFENPPHHALKLVSSSNVFEPNTTTRLLINSVLSIINSKKKILDLGCGTGAVAISLFKERVSSNKIYASDLSQDATECCLQNAKNYNCDSDIRTGSMFEPLPATGGISAPGSFQSALSPTVLPNDADRELASRMQAGRSGIAGLV